MGIPYTNIDKLYIGAQWVKPSERETEPVVNPATEEILGHAPVGGVADAEAAIAAAREAFDNGPWPQMSPAERGKILRRFHAAMTERLKSIQALNIAEVGTTAQSVGKTQTTTALRTLMYAIEQSERIEPHSLPVAISPNLWDPNGPDSIGSGTIVREPMGVVVGITAYNYPLLLNLAKLAPALATGNTLILKPSPYTPFSALFMGEVADEVGLPKGVLNIITGGLDVAKLITSDPRVDMVTFTGSDAVGAAIMGQASPTVKKVLLELGGKSALIVRADADIQTAAMTAVGHVTTHCGQGCVLHTRALVHNSIRPAFVEMVKAIVSQLKVGDPADMGTNIGPLIRDVARSRVERYVQIGLDSGAKLISGGKRPANLKKGYFFEPTFFDNVDNSSALAQDEIFGPVGAIMGFDTDEEAIALANDSRYGLGGSILSKDRAQAYRMALKLRAGNIWVNGGFGGDIYALAPFGGYKRSGLGREYGAGWLNEYMEEKFISYPIA